ncbi:hypothetical protein NDN08_000934 [Rhodosorus marinus]|uniref:Nudix hydrolase domain-containing protein n=1 Tax=Rhodosorus marinus TaxID=101924 RepID=A0AAV8UPI1_9RHOD|nr:hypothetical protein NDN08_000934 [Rhodosorus marinus]
MGERNGKPSGKLGMARAEGDNGTYVDIVTEDVVFKRYGAVLDRCVRYPGGELVKFDIWSKNWRNNNEFCQCVPYDSRTNTVTMIREYFPAQHKFHYGFPGGNVEDKHGSPLSAIQAELEEEAGLYGGEWFPLLDVGKAAPQDKYQEDCLYMYVAVDSQVKEAETSTDVEELITIEHGVPISTVHDRIYKGELQANGIATFLLALRHLKLLEYPV